MNSEPFSAEIKVRKIGETRYEKGTITITDKHIHLNYKKWLTKRQEITIPRTLIEKADFKNVEGPFEIIGPAPQKKWNWTIFVITLTDGTEFEFYVGEVGRMKPKNREKHLEKYKRTHNILTPDKSQELLIEH